MSNLPVPLRFVPTLTEVIQPGSLPPAAVALSPPAPAPAPVESAAHLDLPASSAPEPAAFCAEQEALLVQRVLQRIDLVLERRLQEAIGQLILEHTQALAPLLRQEIESVVRESVAQAFKKETLPGFVA
ncbi:MAG: hypothetical protein M3R45_03285 [Pseudomonadota bacterium]|nr:hypothetical protein [Pseudomonadota bacterium]